MLWVVCFLLEHSCSEHSQLGALPPSITAYLTSWVQKSTDDDDASSTAAPTNETTQRKYATFAGGHAITAFSEKHFVGSWSFHCPQFEATKVARRAKDPSFPVHAPVVLFRASHLTPNGESVVRDSDASFERHDEVFSGPEINDPRTISRYNSLLLFPSCLSTIICTLSSLLY